MHWFRFILSISSCCPCAGLRVQPWASFDSNELVNPYTRNKSFTLDSHSDPLRVLVSSLWAFSHPRISGSARATFNIPSPFTHRRKRVAPRMYNLIKTNEFEMGEDIEKHNEGKAYEMARANLALVENPRKPLALPDVMPSLAQIMQKIDKDRDDDRGDQYYFHLGALCDIRKRNDEIYAAQAFPSEMDRLTIEALPSVNEQETLEGGIRQRGPDGKRFVSRIVDPMHPKSFYLKNISEHLVDRNLLVDIDDTMAKLQVDDDARTEELVIKSFQDRGLDDIKGMGITLMNLCVQVVKRRRLGEPELTAQALWLRVVSRTDELYQVAEQMRDAYEFAILELLHKVGLDLSNLIFGPLKDPVRIYEKAVDDYTKYKQYMSDGVIAEAWTKDVLRCMVTVENAQQMVALQDLLVGGPGQGWQQLGGEEGGVKIRLVRSKNMFDKMVPTHFRFILYNIELAQGPFSIVCELQVSHKIIFAWDVKLASHYHYSFFRAALKRRATTYWSDHIEDGGTDSEIEEMIGDYDEMKKLLWKFGLDYQLSDTRTAAKASPRKRKRIPQGLTQVVGALERDIPHILDIDPNWDLFSKNIALVDQTGIKLEGLWSFKLLLGLMRRLRETLRLKENFEVYYKVLGLGDPSDPTELEIQWNVQFSVPTTALPFGLLALTRSVDIQAITQIKFDNTDRVSIMYLSSWLVNGRPFPEWPDLNLSDEGPENVDKVKAWAEDIITLQSLSPNAQEVVAKRFEEARRAQPYQCPEIAKPGTDREIYVIDFGSRYTRANLVKLRADGSASSERVAGFRGIALQKALEDPVLGGELVEKIASAIPCGHILAGGTEGVRMALETGKITQGQLNDFHDIFSKRIGQRGRFDILSAEEEARAEWRSIEYALRSMEHMQQSGVPTWADVSGMLNAGLLSCQIATRSNTSDEMSFVSFRNLVARMEEWLESRDAFENKSPSSPWFQAFRVSYEDRMRKNVVATNVRGLRGVYILADLWQTLSHRSLEGPGIDPYRTVQVPEVQAALDEWLQKAIDSSEPLSRHRANVILIATMARVVFEEMFDPSAQVCFMGGRDMNWGIGWALEQKITSEVIASYIGQQSKDPA